MHSKPFLSRNERTGFFVLHGAAFLVHSADAVAGFLLLRGRAAPVNIANQFPVFNEGRVESDSCPLTRGEGDAEYTITYRDSCLFQWDGLLALTVAEAITAAFHLFYFIELWVASATQLRPSFLQAWWRDGFHSARWVEYAISATLISLSNFGGVGIRNAPAFIVGAAALVGVQLCGLIAEVARARELHARDAREAAAQEIHDASDEGNEPLLVAVGRHSIVAPLGPRAIDILFQDPFMKKAGDREWRLVEQAYEAVRHPGERPFSVMMRAGHGNPLLYVRECIRKRHCEAPVGFDADKIAQWTAMTIGCLLQGAVFACIFMQIAMSDYEYRRDGNEKQEFTGFRDQSFVYFAHYMTFPVVATLYLTGVIKRFVTAEWIYVSAGVASKTAIFWLIFSTARDLTENWTGEQPATPNVNWPTVRLCAMIIPAALLVLSVVVYFVGVRARVKRA